MMAAANPPITSVRTFRLAMGRDAFRMLTGALAGIEPEQPVVDLGYEVVARGSTARNGQG